MLDRHDKVKGQNVTKKEWEVIDTLKKDDDTIMVLPLDNGCVTVIMKKEDYLKKCNKKATC